ncbi:histidinol-phosphate transaminase [Chakrabartyella piscis]|uniref:histidinol-phosphate transaminase n=1 Tax=Chakrabartyella piscis TaxID=2918914 RepID=UPI0029585754|nr:histidinol-phosphate transaminase [Chakrabartyella piscis]
MDFSNIVRPEVGKMSAYVPGVRSQEVKERFGVENIIKLASNENPLGPSPKAIEAICLAAKEGHIYPDSTAMKVRTLLAKKHNVAVGNILLAAGGEEVIRLFCGTFLNAGEETIISQLGFGLHFRSSQMYGGKVVTIPVKEDLSDDLDAFAENITDKTKIVFVTNPNNPTGIMNSRDEIVKLLAKVPSHVLVMIDEAYFEFAVEHEGYPDCTEFLEQYPNLIILRTLSKVVGLAGIRVGYAIAHENMIAEILKLKAAFNVSSIAQEAAYAALLDEEHIERTILENRKSLEMLKKFFEEKGLHYLPTAANFIFVDLGIGSQKAHEDLIREGVILRPGHLWGDIAAPFTRISSGTVAETQVVIDTLEKYLSK